MRQGEDDTGDMLRTCVLSVLLPLVLLAQGSPTPTPGIPDGSSSNGSSSDTQLMAVGRHMLPRASQDYDQRRRVLRTDRRTAYGLLKSEPCSSDQACRERDPASRCLEQFCVCQHGFTDQFGDRCKKLVQLGETCSDNLVCAGDAVQCADERCACERGFSEDDGACVKVDPSRASSRILLYVVCAATVLFVVGGVSSMLYTQVRQHHINDQACDNCFFAQCTIL